MKTITECRSCKSKKLEELLDLGEHYLSDFRNDFSRPPSCPLVAVICLDCMLVQLRHTANSGDMYHENYGFKSSVSDSIKRDLKNIVSTALEFHSSPRSWLDIASNDGFLLSCVPASIYREGVDPIEKYCVEASYHADSITVGFFKASQFYRKFDVVTSISCFYDMDDPNEFVSDVSKVMENSGIWVIQQNYLLTTIELGAIDNFCAEHLEYYTLLSLEPLLERHGLEVIDVSTSMVNGGSLRTVVAKSGMYPVQDSVQRQREVEKALQLDTLDPYVRFAEIANENIDDLRALVEELNSSGNRICILAASTRGSTIWQAAGLNSDNIIYAVERNPEKVGRIFSAIGVPIVSEEMFRDDKPEYAIIGPWFFKSEIVDREAEYTKQGGHLIMPLPVLEIL